MCPFMFVIWKLLHWITKKNDLALDLIDAVKCNFAKRKRPPRQTCSIFPGEGTCHDLTIKDLRFCFFQPTIFFVYLEIP